MKNKKLLKYIIIGLIIIATVIVGMFFVKQYISNKLQKELVSITTDYYDNEFSVLMPNELKRNEILKIELSTLKQLGKDASTFEKYKCNLNNTFVILTYNEKNGYDIEYSLDCK